MRPLATRGGGFCHTCGMENYHSISATAARLDCHTETVRRLIRRGELAAVKVGAQWRVTDAALQEYFARRAAPAKGAAE